ncbi:RNA-directed DNA polymerase, eukaryota, reverse transcriptase zinc-binding domain protein [Tanacetum coccineum]
MTRLEVFRLKSMWGNYTFDYACSMSRGRSTGLICMWDPNVFVKEEIWCDDAFIIVKGRWTNSVGTCFMINIYGPHDPVAKITVWNNIRDFMQSHRGKYVLFGDMNEVLDEHERYDSIFSRSEADIFNTFIKDTGLIDLPLGGRLFTWMNKAGTKLSKLDRFLFSEDVLEALPDIRVTDLDKLWSDHNPILLHCNKSDYGPIPVKIYHSWFLREDFDSVITQELASIVPIDGINVPFQEKLKRLKMKIRQWHIHIKSNDGLQKAGTSKQFEESRNKD